MTQLGNWLSNLWHRIVTWRESYQQSQVKTAAVEETPAIEQVLGVEEETAGDVGGKKGVLHLEHGRIGILVPCASCASLHELEAVCYRCGSPLCSDVTNCRLSFYLEDVGHSVVICPTCRGQ